MSDETNDGEAAAAAPAGDNAQTQPALTVQAQYIKDLSFEAPGTPGIFAQLQNNQPEISLGVNVNVQSLDGQSYEVILSLRAECKLGEAVCFLCELDYAGVFRLNVEDQYRQAVLLIECPRMLFPFARHIMSVMSRDGGFPPLLIGPIDFVQMYQQRIQQAGQQAAQADGGNGGAAEE